MADLLAALTSGAGNAEVLVAGLRAVLRNASTTGRTSRAVLRAALQLVSNAEQSVPVRLLAYEACWSIVGASDSAAYRALLACARNDMLVADHPALSLAALATLAAMPACFAADIMAGEEVERTMTDAMLGDAPPAVRCASVTVFTQVAVAAAMQAADEGRRGGSLSHPHESDAAAARHRAVMHEKCVEVLRGAVGAMEDASPDVAAAGFAAVRRVLEAAALPGAVGIGAGSAAVERGVAASSRLLRELARRVTSRFNFASARVRWLRPGGRAHAHRALTLSLVLAVLDADGRTGGAGGLAAATGAGAPRSLLDATPPRLRLEAPAFGGAPAAVALLAAYVEGALCPELQRPLGGLSGSGPFTAAALGAIDASLPGVGGAPGAGGAAGSAALAAALDGAAGEAPLALLEACRAIVQLAASFPASAAVARRQAAAEAAAGDLGAVLGAAASPGAAASSPGENALLLSCAPLEALGAGAAQDASFAALAGPLQPWLSGGLAAGAAPVPSATATVLAPALRRALPLALGALSHLLLRRVASGPPGGAAEGVALSSGGGGGGTGGGVSTAPGAGPVLVATAGLAGAASVTAGTAAAVGEATGASPSGPGGGQATATGEGAAAQQLGGGSSSGLQQDGALRRGVTLLVGACLAQEPGLLLAACPAVLREIGRLGDDVPDDAGLGSGHNATRVGLAFRLLSGTVHALLHEQRPRQLTAAGAAEEAVRRARRRGRGAALESPPAPAPPPTAPAWSVRLAAILHDASRPLGAGGGGQAAGGGGGVPRLAPGGALGDAHGAEVAAVSTRFRAELAGVALQCLVRAMPPEALLATAARGAVERPQSRAAGAQGAAPATAPPGGDASLQLHAWLMLCFDTLATCCWLLEHRLSFGGVALGARDAVAPALARVMGAPDAPAPAPGSVAHPRPCSLFDGDGSGAPLVGLGRYSAVASAGGGGATTTGWAWAREYEAVCEASDCFVGVLTAVAAALYPAAGPASYTPVGFASPACGGAAGPAGTAHPLRPPALALHRSRLQRLSAAVFSSLDLGVYRTYEIERAAQALAPRQLGAGGAAGRPPAPSASAARGAAYDVLPSAVPLQLRLLWLLAAVWDGCDGSEQPAPAPGAAPSPLSHLFPLPLPAPLPAVQQEALRQKRLASLVGLLAGEAGIALGIGGDVEAAGKRAVALAASLAAAATAAAASVDGHGEAAQDGPFAGGSGGSSGGGPPGTPLRRDRGATAAGAFAALQQTPGAAQAGGGGAASSPGAAASVASWMRGSKIGKALGFFGRRGGGGKGRGDKDAAAAAAAPVYGGEGTVVSYAHFWLLIDCLAQVAATQRCTAGQVKRAVECMLVQPKLSGDVGDTLMALLPRLCLFQAAYGASAVGRGLAPHATAPPAQSSWAISVTSVDLVATIAAQAQLAAAAPWALTLFSPQLVIRRDGTVGGTDGGLAAGGAGAVAARMLEQLAAFESLVSVEASNGGTGGAAIAGWGLPVIADMLTPPTLALVAAAAAPDLTQNAVLGLNRSAASGARMRFAVPCSAVLPRGGLLLAVARAALARPARPPSASAPPPPLLPLTLVGSVPLVPDPAAAAAALAARPPPKRLLAPAGGEQARAAPPLAAARLAQRIASAWALPGPLDHGRGAAGAPGLGVGAGASLGTLVTSSSDPLALALAHTLLPGCSRLLLHVTLTNHTRFRIPAAGVAVTLHLGPALAFPRGAATASLMVLSGTARLGAAGGGGGASPAGSGVAGGPPLALFGDFVVMQRGSLHHATQSFLRPLPPGGSIAYDVVLAVAGFGPLSVRAGLVMEGVQHLPEGAEGAEGAPGEAVAAAVRASRAVGASAAEDAVDEEGGWWAPGALPGRPGAPGAASSSDATPACWGVASLPQPAPDGLIWAGADLNNAKKGRLLPGAAGPAMSISRPVAGGGGGGSGPGAPSGLPSSPQSQLSVGGGGIANPLRASRPASIGSGFSFTSRRESVGGGPELGSVGAGSGPAGQTGADDAEDAVSTGSGGGGDAGTDVPGEGGAGGEGGGGDEEAGAGSALDAGGAAGGAARPFATRRVTLMTNPYRVAAAAAFLSPAPIRLPPALALALASGCDVLPGAAAAFALRRPALSSVAAAGVQGGGFAALAALAGSGSVPSIATSLVTCALARLPFAHYAAAASAPAALGESPCNSEDWLIACLAEGLRGSWARVDLPNSPLPAAHGPVLRVAQAAFSARTWAGTHVMLLATGELTRLRSEGDGGGGRGPPALAAWAVALQLRCDDARVRAALVAELGELVHSASCGRLRLVAHGHAALVSPLSRQDVAAGGDGGGNGVGEWLHAVSGAVATETSHGSSGGAAELHSFHDSLALPAEEEAWGGEDGEWGDEAARWGMPLHAAIALGDDDGDRSSDDEDGGGAPQ